MPSATFLSPPGPAEGSGAPRPEKVLDVRGFSCPIPALRTRRALAGLSAGGVLCVQATDPHARIDIAALCARDGHEVLACTEEAEGVLHFLLRRGEA